MKIAVLRATQYGYVIVIVLLLMIVPTSAKITGSIGNARMVLKIPAGESMDKCILVKNVNDADVEIQLIPAGELTDSIVLKESQFTVAAGTEKNACFTITALQEGTTETKINVMFSPVGGGNGVGLSSTIIVISEKKPSILESVFGNADDKTDESNSSISGILLLSLLITIILIVLLMILVFSSRNKHHEFSSAIESKPGVKTKK